MSAHPTTGPSIPHSFGQRKALAFHSFSVSAHPTTGPSIPHSFGQRKALPFDNFSVDAYNSSKVQVSSTTYPSLYRVQPKAA